MLTKIQRLRFKLDSASETQLADVYSGINTPGIWRAMELNVEIGLYQGGGAAIVDSFANLVSITCAIKNAKNLKGAAIVSKTLPVASLAVITDAHWLDLSAQTGTFCFSRFDIALPLPDEADTDSFVMVFTAILTDGSKIVLGFTKLVCTESGSGSDIPNVAGGGYAGQVAIAQGVESVVVNSLALTFTPVGALTRVMKPAGGMNIEADPVIGSFSVAGFTVELTGRPDTGTYVLSYLLF